MACENCDYTDTIIPMDYTKSAFQFVNRKLYHNWKMIGIQASHDFVYGKIHLDSSGRLRGVASGCKPIEEINQNNQMIGRGAWYFRAKVDGYDGQKSATYGIMGHCQSPGLVSQREYLGGVGPADVQNNIQPSARQMEDPDLGTPFYRGWGLYQGSEFCACADGFNDTWHMAVFIQGPKYDIDGKFVPNQYEYYMQYDVDDDCGKFQDFEAKENCLARNSRRPGRFTSWDHLGGGVRRKWNTCEALSYTDQQAINNYGCLQTNASLFNSNDILGSAANGSFGPLMPMTIRQGVLVKLTSLPSCNHFDKVTRRIVNQYVNPENGQITYQYDVTRCERAAIRFAGWCNSGVGWGPSCAIGRSGTSKKFNYNVQEFHYDRWDKAIDGAGGESAYKIFDELYEVPELSYKIRVLAHKKSVIMNYYNQKEGYEQSTWMTQRYVTGGSPTDSLSTRRGCMCQNSSSGEGTPYPIRPYNTFVYCPNNFTCDKKCVNQDGTVKIDPTYTPGA